jgi:putative DNA modification/repair radical SAM protein
LFLSSGIFKNPDYTMERLVAIIKKLRIEHKFNGYIHLKTIPGCSELLMKDAGLYADRMSINIEMPTELSLQSLAPQKNFKEIVTPMRLITENIQQYKSEKKLIKYAPKFVPAGQSTQMIIGATPDTDKNILTTANHLYEKFNLKRVYYSGYIPINNSDNRLPMIGTSPPLIREHRLYQTDWLYRFYDFSIQEIVDDNHQNLELDIDPKLSWALRNLHLFPIDVNTADYHLIVRIPGIGVVSAKKIIAARRFRKLDSYMLKKLGIAYNRAKYFLTCNDTLTAMPDLLPIQLKQRILREGNSKYEPTFNQQLSLF